MNVRNGSPIYGEMSGQSLVEIIHHRTPKMIQTKIRPTTVPMGSPPFEVTLRLSITKGCCGLVKPATRSLEIDHRHDPVLPVYDDELVTHDEVEVLPPLRVHRHQGPVDGYQPHV